MTRLVQLSDPHIDATDPGRAPARALEEAVRAVLALEPGPDAVLVSGDLTERGDAASYEQARELLAPLGVPVHVLPGNHDDREALRASFAATGEAGPPGTPFRYAARCGALRLLVCDTARAGREDGRLDEEALAWLERELGADADTPTIVAVHHPPIVTGIGAMDAIGLPEGDRRALGELLARSPQVRRVVAGHVHRSTVNMLGGCPVFVGPSTYLQVRLAPDADRPVLEPAPPSFAIHALLPDGTLVTHVQPVASG